MELENDEFTLRKKGMTVRVFNNNVDGAIVQLKRRMNTEGVNKELRKRKHFTSPSMVRRQKLAEAKLRWKKKYAQIMELDLPKKKRSVRPDRMAPRPASAAPTQTS